jgi:hypothetical protein
MKNRIKKAINLLHSCLLENYSNFECKVKDHLKEDEEKRSSIHEDYRKALEIRIDNWKDMIKSSKKIELMLREIFDYIDYDMDNKYSRISKLELESKKLKEHLKAALPAEEFDNKLNQLK